MPMKRIWRTLPAALLLAAITAGCSGTGTTPSSQTTAQAGSTSPAATDSAYPYPGPAATDSAYPGPQTPPPSGRQPEPIPAPESGMGVIHGTLYDANTEQPIYDGVLVFLSPVVNTSTPDMDAVRLNIQTDRNITPDVQGGFAFGAVPPGRYGIVVKTPLKEYMARRSDDKNKDVILTVEAGQTVDLGKIYTTYP
jgi:hypothetical protein